MILSIAQASSEEAGTTEMFGIWSDMVVGDRPTGLVDSYLLQGDGTVHVVSVWESQEAHDAALQDKATNHPAYGFFDACGLDPTHATFRVIGRMG